MTASSPHNHLTITPSSPHLHPIIELASPHPHPIIAGDSDKRVADRQRYATQMRDCTLRSLPGANVLPWESARQTCEAIAAFSAGIRLEVGDS